MSERSKILMVDYQIEESNLNNPVFKVPSVESKKDESFLNDRLIRIETDNFGKIVEHNNSYTGFFQDFDNEDIELIKKR